jgi:hypothetical protein
MRIYVLEQLPLLLKIVCVISAVAEHNNFAAQSREKLMLKARGFL